MASECCYVRTFFLTILNLQKLILIAQIIIPLQAFSSSSPGIHHHINSKANKLKQLCLDARSKKKTIILPGIYDSLSAKIFADTGAKVLFLSGFGVSASKLGQPDIGILTQTEMEDTLRSVVQVVSSHGTPVIVDGDTGYGEIMNIRRTIRNFAAAGAAAITIEDQSFPKKCTYAAGMGVKVVSFNECRTRIKAAIAARNEARSIDGNDVLIVARTDCRAALGLDEAIRRCKMFEEEGADICYAENLQSKQEYEYLKAMLHQSTLTMLAQVQLQNRMNEFAEDLILEQTLFNAEEISDMGFDLALFGVTPLQAIVQTLTNVATNMLDTNNGLVDEKIDFSTFFHLKKVVGFNEAEIFASLHGSDNEIKGSE